MNSMARLLKQILLVLVLLGFSFIVFAADTWEPQKVKMKRPDGAFLVGNYMKAKGKNPTVVMMHGLRSNKEEWTAWASTLTAQGWGALAFDLRGHGESSLTKDKNGNPNGFMHFGPIGKGSKWEKMIDDAGVAVRFLTDDGIKRDSIFLAGASLGANVALSYAVLARMTKGVVLFSPGMVYLGLEIGTNMRRAGDLPVLMMASEEDSFSYKSVNKLISINPRATLWTDVKAGHGVQMFDEQLFRRLMKWLKAQ